MCTLSGTSEIERASTHPWPIAGSALSPLILGACYRYPKCIVSALTRDDLYHVCEHFIVTLLLVCLFLTTMHWWNVWKAKWLNNNGIISVSSSLFFCSGGTSYLGPTHRDQYISGLWRGLLGLYNDWIVRDYRKVISADNCWEVHATSVESDNLINSVLSAVTLHYWTMRINAVYTIYTPADLYRHLQLGTNTRPSLFNHFVSGWVNPVSIHSVTLGVWLFIFVSTHPTEPGINTVQSARGICDRSSGEQKWCCILEWTC